MISRSDGEIRRLVPEDPDQAGRRFERVPVVDNNEVRHRLYHDAAD